MKITTKQAAEMMGVSERRVRGMIEEGTIRAEKVGRDWSIDSASIPTARMVGRPKKDQDLPEPRVFISYSWSSDEHKDFVRSIADRLINDHIDVVIDQYDLKPGNDGYAFMESMVSDPSITHVLVFCDKAYASKANNGNKGSKHSSGVGTETQIISPEVYTDVSQTKFIPVVCEFDENGNAYLPTYLKGRIYINFSTDQAVAQEWEGLIRLIYDRPAHVKPALGSPPSFLIDDSSDTNLASIEATLTQFNAAIKGNSPGIDCYADDIFRSVISPGLRRWTRACVCGGT